MLRSAFPPNLLSSSKYLVWFFYLLNFLPQATLFNFTLIAQISQIILFCLNWIFLLFSHWRGISGRKDAHQSHFIGKLAYQGNETNGHPGTSCHPLQYFYIFVFVLNTPLPLTSSAAALRFASGIAQVDGYTRVLSDNTQLSEMLRSAFPPHFLKFQASKLESFPRQNIFVWFISNLLNFLPQATHHKSHKYFIRNFF